MEASLIFPYSSRSSRFVPLSSPLVASILEPAWYTEDGQRSSLVSPYDRRSFFAYGYAHYLHE